MLELSNQLATADDMSLAKLVRKCLAYGTVTARSLVVGVIELDLRNLNPKDSRHIGGRIAYTLATHTALLKATIDCVGRLDNHP